jgi:hypothetical protein
VRASVLREHAPELVRVGDLDEEAYAAATDLIYRKIRAAGLVSELRIGIDHLIMGGDLAEAGLTGDDKAVRAALARARAHLWPDVARPVPGGRGVTIV